MKSRRSESGAFSGVRLKTPRASEVLLAGDFNGWNPQANPLKKDRNGFWKTTLILPSGRYEFKFMVDSRRRENLETELTAPNSYGTLNNVVVVGGAVIYRLYLRRRSEVSIDGSARIQREVARFELVALLCLLLRFRLLGGFLLCGR